MPDQGNSGERKLPNIFDTDDLIDEFDRDDDVSDLIIDAEESHRGAFGDYGGESGGLIERTFRERIVLVGVTLAGDDPEETDASLDELALLVDTAGGERRRDCLPESAERSGVGRSRRAAPAQCATERGGAGRAAVGVVAAQRALRRGQLRAGRRAQGGRLGGGGDGARHLDRGESGLLQLAAGQAQHDDAQLLKLRFELANFEAQRRLLVLEHTDTLAETLVLGEQR